MTRILLIFSAVARALSEHRADVLAIGGALLLALGIALIYVPAGLIAAGLLLFLLGVLLDLQPRPPAEPEADQ